MSKTLGGQEKKIKFTGGVLPPGLSEKKYYYLTPTNHLKELSKIKYFFANCKELHILPGWILQFNLILFQIKIIGIYINLRRKFFSIGLPFISILLQLSTSIDDNRDSVDASYFRIVFFHKELFFKNRRINDGLSISHGRRG